MDFNQIASRLKEPLKTTDWYAEMMFYLNSDELPRILEKMKEHTDLGYNFTPKIKYVFNPLLRTPYSNVNVLIVEETPIPFLNYSDGMPFSFLERPDHASHMFYEHLFPQISQVSEKMKGETMKKLHQSLCESGFLFFNFSVTTEIDRADISHYQIWKSYVNLFFDIINSHQNDILIVALSKRLKDFIEKACPKKTVIYRESPAVARKRGTDWRSENLAQEIEKVKSTITFSNIYKNL